MASRLDANRHVLSSRTSWGSWHGGSVCRTFGYKSSLTLDTIPYFFWFLDHDPPSNRVRIDARPINSPAHGHTYTVSDPYPLGLNRLPKKKLKFKFRPYRSVPGREISLKFRWKTGLRSVAYYATFFDDALSSTPRAAAFSRSLALNRSTEGALMSRKVCVCSVSPVSSWVQRGLETISIVRLAHAIH